METNKSEEGESFDWLQVSRNIGFGQDDISQEENSAQKLVRKFKENPFVPIGCLATVGCLAFGIFSFHSGERRMSQLMMRARIIAQGFTVVALLVGVSAAAIKKDPPSG